MKITSVLVGAGAGAGLMYLLDPDLGNRRRALVRDKLVRARHLTGDAMDATSRDVRNRARGVVAELRSRLIPGEVSDDVLQERVRARLGQVVGYASAILATVDDGRVTLRGPVLADDAARLVRRIGRVPGVREVDNQLESHAEASDIPALQGARPTRRGEVLPLIRGELSPTARLVTGLGGALLTLWGLRRLGTAGMAVTTIGMSLLTRGAGSPGVGDLVNDLRRVLSRR